MTQITIRELLKDEEYKKYFLTVPRLPEHYKGTKPWKLLVRLKGESKWRAKRFETYKEAVIALKKYLPKAEDVVINCPPLGFRPPLKNVRLKGQYSLVRGKKVPVFRTVIWKPKLEDDHGRHTWCSYCRRPTIFKVLAARIHTINGDAALLSEPRLRCTICSSSETIVNIKNPEKEQAWDSSAPALYEIYRK